MGKGASGRRHGSPARAALAALVVAAALAVGAAPASAIIVHLSSGKALSYQPLRGSSASAAKPKVRLFDEFFSNLDYNGGPVMPENTNYTVYWRPASAEPYPAGYKEGLNTYFTDLAADSGRHTNVDSVSTQYNDAAGEFANYSSHFGGEIVVTDAYPTTKNCKAATICLTDAQIQAELAKVVKEHHLPIDLKHEYFLLTPPNVESCFEQTGGVCSANSTEPFYCAYHGNAPTTEGELIYSNDPYVTGNPGCDDGNHPNEKPSDGALQGGLSHEHNESITDPLPNSAWTDFATGEVTGFENGDKCASEAVETGEPLGTAPDGSPYNQVINGHLYWYQEEWSNQNHTCLQSMTFSGERPTGAFTATPGTGTNVTFDASRSTAPGGVARYSWQFNDFGEPAEPVETTSPVVTHEFPEEEPVTVALTVFSSNGTSIGAARTFQVGGTAPTAAFVFAPPTPAPGAPVSFDGSASTANAGSITAYEWSFGDGSFGVGVKPSHAYAAGGEYHVKLTVTNTGNLSRSVTETVLVGASPSAAFSVATAAPTAGSPVAFDATASKANEGSITKYAWDFGDAGHGEGATPNHTYAAAGEYEVTLTVTNSAGHSNSTKHRVLVAAAAGGGGGSGGSGETGGGSGGSGETGGGSGGGSGSLTGSLSPALLITPAPPTATVALAASSVAVKSNGQASLKLSCSGSASICSGELALTVKRRSRGHTLRLTLVKAPFKVAEGTSTVKLRLKRSLLRGLGAGASATLVIRKVSPAPAATVSDPVRLRLVHGH